VSGTTIRGLFTELLPPLASVPAIVVGARVAVVLLESVLDDWLLLLAAVASGGVAGLAVLLAISPLWRDFATRSLLLVRRQMSPIR
jgi:small-conductance mechanosensitive channel